MTRSRTDFDKYVRPETGPGSTSDRIEMRRSAGWLRYMATTAPTKYGRVELPAVYLVDLAEAMERAAQFTAGHCDKCGDEFDRTGRSSLWCVGCLFWNEWAQRVPSGMTKGRQRIARINGQHMVLGTRTRASVRDASLLGCSGARHRIRFHDGTDVICEDLWHQGEIPSCWRDELPDNAEWVRS